MRRPYASTGTLCEIRQQGELIDLGGGQELRFVDQDAGWWFLAVAHHDRREIGIALERDRIRAEADARGDGARCEPVVDRGGEQQGPHAALAIIEIGLEQGGRLPAFIEA